LKTAVHANKTSKATPEKKASSNTPSMDKLVDILVCKCRPVVKLYEDYSEKRKKEMEYYLKSLMYSVLCDSLPDEYKVKIRTEFMQVVKEIMKNAPI
jgi:hypothetical protein